MSFGLAKPRQVGPGERAAEFQVWRQTGLQGARPQVQQTGCGAFLKSGNNRFGNNGGFKLRRLLQQDQVASRRDGELMRHGLKALFDSIEAWGDNP